LNASKNDPIRKRLESDLLDDNEKKEIFSETELMNLPEKISEFDAYRLVSEKLKKVIGQ
jgi:hypothetical protein